MTFKYNLNYCHSHKFRIALDYKNSDRQIQNHAFLTLSLMYLFIAKEQECHKITDKTLNNTWLLSVIADKLRH